LKQLIVNADDFGFTRDVNAGIVEAHERGILTATTLMANGDAFDDAVALARRSSTLDIGCHLVLIGGQSLLDGREFPQTVAQFLRASMSGSFKIYEELRAQVQKIVAAGVTPTHLDTHKHTHLYPPVLDAVVRIGQEFGIRWIRRPFDFPLQPGVTPWTKRAVSRSFGVVRSRFHRIIAEHGCATTDHFAGFQITGRFEAAEVVELIQTLPEGSTEFMVHPGHCGAELQASRTRLKESRAKELAAITAPEVRRAMEQCGVKLVSYREL
jgi:chitin disaccharide deacetylase